MNDALFVDAAVWAQLVSWVGEFCAFGTGLAVVYWLLGYIVYFIVDAVRGVC